jgi:hypothetical protein
VYISFAHSGAVLYKSPDLFGAEDCEKTKHDIKNRNRMDIFFIVFVFISNIIK